MQNSSFIWSEKAIVPDSYRRFRKTFDWDGNKRIKAILSICADSTFTAFVNGVRCPIAQVADFPRERTFSTLDVTKLLKPGKNAIAVEVHFLGESFLTYKPGTPFLKAELNAGKRVLAATDATWKCRHAAPFADSRLERMTSQLGYTFEYDARQETNWTALDFDDAQWPNAIVYEDAPKYWDAISPRAVPQLTELPLMPVTVAHTGYLLRQQTAGTPAELSYADFLAPDEPRQVIKEPLPAYTLDKPLVIHPDGDASYTFRTPDKRLPCNGFYIILDHGCDTVGYLTLRVTAPAGTIIDISNGEHLADGRVRSYMGGRNFTDRIICKDGLNELTYTHRRIGARYLELHILAPSDAVSLHYAGLIPLELPLPQEAQFSSNDGFLTRLNKISIDTLKLCMHEHYEDCPWREQGLYAYDSRNQMLYGYYVWGNYDFAAASLNLLGKSYNGGRYLTITAPTGTNLTIPIFSLVWISEIYEHWLYSGSSQLFDTWQPLIDTILRKALEDAVPGTKGLYCPCKPEECKDGVTHVITSDTNERIWNFCEWNGSLSYLSGLRQAPFNVYLYEALTAAEKLHTLKGNTAQAKAYHKAAAAMPAAINKAFWNAKLHRYDACAPSNDPQAYEHIQAIMLANGLVPENRVEAVLNLFRKKELCPVDLSALVYLIRGLMSHGPDARKIMMRSLAEIYEPVVFSGATTVWECRNGETAFERAGSLCHAWSSASPYVSKHCFLGVTPIDPGFARFEVSPFPAHLHQAEGDIPTPYGPITVRWTMSAQDFNVFVRYPKGTLPILKPLPEYPVTHFQTEEYSK